MEAGKVIRWKRSERKMTQQELATRAGINRKHLSDIELCRFSPGEKILVSIATVLDFDLNLLKNGPVAPKKPQP